MDQHISIYDTTLRDGCQGERVAFSVDDKLRVAHRLDDLGVAYIEGGWPNETNPRDREFFLAAKRETWTNARITAFGSTRRGGIKAVDDSNLNELIDSGAKTIAIFGKSWDMHATEVLRVSLDEVLAMIKDSVEYLKQNVEEVIFDAEHFFDGYKSNPDFALKSLQAAVKGGADMLCLCDTNGGTMPWEVEDIIHTVMTNLDTPLSIHCHNDSGTATATSLAALRAGCTQVQGTINGYGERAGNANLCELIPNIELKLGIPCLPPDHLIKLTSASKFISELANLPHHHRQPYVGESAFAHKGGMHVNAVLKRPDTFEHIDPELVGNQRRILVSDVAGTSTIAVKLQQMWPDLDRKDPFVRQVLDKVKKLENQGYEFEAAEASLTLLAQELRGEKVEKFKLHGYRVLSGKHEEHNAPFAEATVELEIDGLMFHTAAMGTGPVNALDKALRKALVTSYPQVEQLELLDYKVRVLEGTHGTETVVRVIIETGDGEESWGTVGVHANVIEASWKALVDSITYGLRDSN